MEEFISYDVVRHIVEMIVFTPADNEQLREAAEMWLKCRGSALLRYGNILYWDMRYITSARNLSCHRHVVRHNCEDNKTASLKITKAIK